MWNGQATAHVADCVAATSGRGIQGRLSPEAHALARYMPHAVQGEGSKMRPKGAQTACKTPAFWRSDNLGKPISGKFWRSGVSDGRGARMFVCASVCRCASRVGAGCE